MLIQNSKIRTYRVGHLACGLGSGALGFQKARPRIPGLAARFETAGGIDIDPGALANFEHLTGVKGTHLDLFDRGQYVAFHGHEPPEDWREATPADLRAVFGHLDVAFSSPPCLPGDGLIVSQIGDRPIETARVGEKVLTHRGRMRRITHVGSHMYRGSMHSIRVQGSVDEQRYTAEHPIWVRRFVRDSSAINKRRLDEARFINAIEVQVGDRVGFPIRMGRNGAAQEYIEGFGDLQIIQRGGRNQGKYTKPLHEAMNVRGHDLRPHANGKALWFLIGAFLGDGYLRQSNRFEIGFCLGARDCEVANDVRHALNELGISHYNSGTPTNNKVMASSKSLHTVLAAFGRGASEKRLPPAVFEIEDNCVDAMIEGYLSTDGSESAEKRSVKGNVQVGHRKRLASTSLQLLRDFQRLILRQGFYAGIAKIHNGGPAIIEGRTVKTKPRWEVSWYPNSKRRTYTIENGVAWLRVRSVSAEDVEERVWNLSVEEDETYCSPLIATHNCKGLTSLLDPKHVGSPKYEALNELTVRCYWLLLEAYKDDPIKILLLENVPGLATKGRRLLDKIYALLRHYGYAVAEDSHDVGPIGGLAQHRKRFLMVARHRELVPPFLYRPEIKPMKTVGEVLGALPLPGDPRGGIMHRIPNLKWRTWARLAFINAGSDWRSLHDLEVENGHLRDWAIQPLDGFASTIDDLMPPRAPHNQVLGVRGWNGQTGVVQGASRPHNGTFCVADPRYGTRDRRSTLGVRDWDGQTGTVTGQTHPTNGAFSVGDPRQVPLLEGARYFEIVPRIGNGFDDPRAQGGRGGRGKYRVTRMDEASGTVISSSTTGEGAYAVADDRFPIPESAMPGSLPDGNDSLVAIIIARDGTWHRPFTTLDLAALQSVVDPEEVSAGTSPLLLGNNQENLRLWIGNAVPAMSAAGLAETIGEVLLMAETGTTFQLSSREIWCKPGAIALTIDPTAPGGAHHIEAGLGQ